MLIIMIIMIMIAISYIYALNLGAVKMKRARGSHILALAGGRKMPIGPPSLLLRLQKEADRQHVFLNRVNSLPKAVAAATGNYFVVITDQFVYKATNCSKWFRVQSLITEYRVAKTLKKVYNFDVSDIVTPTQINLYATPKQMVLFLVLPAFGCSVRKWLQLKKRNNAERICVAAQIDKIHQRFLSLNFFHGDMKPSNFLVSNQTWVQSLTGQSHEQLLIKVAACDFGLSSFAPKSDGNKDFGARGTPLFKLKSFSLHCKNWQLASTFQLVMTNIFVCIEDCIRTALTCQRNKCCDLHEIEDSLRTFYESKKSPDKSFLQLLAMSAFIEGQ